MLLSYTFFLNIKVKILCSEYMPTHNVREGTTKYCQATNIYNLSPRSVNHILMSSLPGYWEKLFNRYFRFAD